MLGVRRTNALQIHDPEDERHHNHAAADAEHAGEKAGDGAAGEDEGDDFCIPHRVSPFHGE